jgi:hypothetical protein
VVEGAALEKRCGLTLTGGSNPSPSDFSYSSAEGFEANPKRRPILQTGTRPSGIAMNGGREPEGLVSEGGRLRRRSEATGEKESLSLRFFNSKRGREGEAGDPSAQDGGIVGRSMINQILGVQS